MVKVVKAYNQGKSITPRSMEVEIVWENDLDVYYRVLGEVLVRQTPRERFYKICRMVTEE